ncbi:MAG: hypothetical protein IJ404_04120 [Clostridia bacterium]|nr:hypothetical protein [Clostridia bacterium]
MDFKNIPNKYRPIPFWSWNEKLDTVETAKQIEQMHNVGIGGFFMHARGGLQTEYMGKEWFDNIAAGVEMGKKLGMGAWAYDENGWPSGFGGGVINGKGVKYQQKTLFYEKGEKETETTIANIDGYHFYYKVNPFYVDLLDKEVTKAFLDEVYLPYYEKFGKDLSGFFTDEPQLSQKGIPWSLTLPDEYKKEYGEDLISVLPALYFEYGDYKNTRIKFWRLITKLFSANFAGQIFEWCDSRGLKFTGHMVMEEMLVGQLRPNGAIMSNYKNFHIPGMDCLGRQKIQKTTIYQVASVAEQFGKKQVLSETFALTGWNVSFEEQKQMFEWQMVRGVNLLCTHLAAYSLRGIRKRDYPAAFSYQEPWWEKYNVFVDYVSRIGMLLSEGKKECDTLLIHPQTTTWTLYNGGVGSAEIVKLDRGFNEAIDKLERKHIRFHLGDETLMEEYARVENGALIIGEQKYTSVVILPDTVLYDSTQKLLSELEKQGGKIYYGTDEIKPDNIVDREEIIYTKRSFDEFDMYYFVNTVDEKLTAKIAKGTHILNATNGETAPFFGEIVFEPSGSAVVLDYGKPVEKAEVKAENKALDLSGEWEIVSSDPNAITLDKCTYYFDGELIEENGPIISIQEKACALERKVRIDMKYSVKADFLPSELYLVTETPEIFKIFINGKEIEKRDCGYYRDRVFRKLDITNYFKIGENEILVVCEFEQSKTVYENIEKSKIFETEKNKLTYDMEIESIYLVGNFSVKTEGEFELLPKDAVRYHGDFVVSSPKTEISLSAIERQGFPFFNGKMTVKKIFDMRKGDHKIEFNKVLASAVSVKVNGNDAGDIIFRPYSVDISKHVTDGENEIELTFITSLRNLLGPHHIDEGETYEVTPACFHKEDTMWGTWCKKPWNDDYCFVINGIE